MKKKTWNLENGFVCICISSHLLTIEYQAPRKRYSMNMSYNYGTSLEVFAENDFLKFTENLVPHETSKDMQYYIKEYAKTR